MTFTPAVVPDYLKGFKVPLRVVSWQWVPVGGSGQTLACGPGVSVCTTEVKEAGTMTVTAVVNGVEQTSSVRIEAVPCVVGDSLIDNPVLRAGLAAAWNESRSDFPIDLRIERGMYLFDSSNVYTYRLTPINPTVDGPCRNAATPVFPFPGRAVTGGHTHPFALGDSLPALCRPPNLPPWAFTTYGNPYGGPSAPDWVRSWNDSLPHVVIDKDSIYRIHPHPIDSVQGPTEWQYFPTPGWESKYLAAPRVVGSCVRI